MVNTHLLPFELKNIYSQQVGSSQLLCNSMRNQKKCRFFSVTLCFTISENLGTLEPDLHTLIVIGPKKKRKRKNFCLILEIINNFTVI